MENAPKARHIKHCTNCTLAGHTRPKWPLLNSLNRVLQNPILTGRRTKSGPTSGSKKTQIRKQRQNDIENKSDNDFNLMVLEQQILICLTRNIACDALIG